MQQDQIIFLKAIKYAALTLAALTVAGIATLMFIASDKNEDITGIVAPAILITMISTGVANTAAVLQKRSSGRDGAATFTNEK